MEKLQKSLNNLLELINLKNLCNVDLLFSECLYPMFKESGLDSLIDYYDFLFEIETTYMLNNDETVYCKEAIKKLINDALNKKIVFDLLEE